MFFEKSGEIGYIVISETAGHVLYGQVVCGKDFDEVFERAMFFEMACRIIILSGGRYEVLTGEEIEDLEIYISGRKP